MKKPAEYDDRWSALRLLDERSDSGWASPEGQVGQVGPHQLLIELAEESVVAAVEFDSGNTDGDSAGSRSAKDIVVEVSSAGPESGFQAIASVSLEPRADRQRSP